ncbi:Semaphorin-2A, partial [Fragariocoptes setiger]
CKFLTGFGQQQTSAQKCICKLRQLCKSAGDNIKQLWLVLGDNSDRFRPNSRARRGQAYTVSGYESLYTHSMVAMSLVTYLLVMFLALAIDEPTPWKPNSSRHLAVDTVATYESAHPLLRADLMERQHTREWGANQRRQPEVEDPANVAATIYIGWMSDTQPPTSGSVGRLVAQSTLAHVMINQSIYRRNQRDNNSGSLNTETVIIKPPAIVAMSTAAAMLENARVCRQTTSCYSIINNKLIIVKNPSSANNSSIMYKQLNEIMSSSLPPRRRYKCQALLSSLLSFVVVVILSLLLPLLTSQCCTLVNGQHYQRYQQDYQQVSIAADPSATTNNVVLAQHETSKDFTCGKYFYRTFYLDASRDQLYVGSMDHVFRLNLANINRTSCETNMQTDKQANDDAYGETCKAPTKCDELNVHALLVRSSSLGGNSNRNNVDANANSSDSYRDAIRLAPTDPMKCAGKGKSENYDCRNHIKVIQPVGKYGDKLYVCGTNAYNPKDYLITSNLSYVPDHTIPGIGGSAQAECPYDPDDNSTAVWVEHGNPSDAPALYSGSVAEFSKADTLIFRSELYNATRDKVNEAKRTIKYDSTWLDKPNFVGSFDIGDYVYFFFRESAVEFINCGKSIYSRVARVCKKDNGSKRHLNDKVWTTYLKARLNCSIPGEFPFYFDEIQSIYRNPYDDRKFHGIFTTSNNGLTGSAICTFSLSSIQEAFNGKFKEQLGSGSAWLPVPSFKVQSQVSANEPKPGTCVDDTQQLSDTAVNFIRSHPLMDSAVAHDNGRPVFYRRDVMFTKIVVDTLELDGVRYTVYFAGTNTGKVYKIVEWNVQDVPLAGGGSSFGWSSQNSAGTRSNLIEIFEATPTPEPIRALEISARHKSLYVASDSAVRQFSLLNCKQRHDSCLQCSRDPYCGWDKDRQECRHQALSIGGSGGGLNLLQDVAVDFSDVCQNHIRHKDVHVTWGQSVHLPCPLSLPDLDVSLMMAAASASSPPLSGVASAARQSSLYQQQQQHSYVNWFYHRHHDGMMQGYPTPIPMRRDKFVLAADQGLVIMSANEPGWYQCRLNSQVLYSYNLIVDTKTCSAPSDSEFRVIYANWCREMEKYKLAHNNWQKKRQQCQVMNSGMMPQIGM